MSTTVNQILVDSLVARKSGLVVGPGLSYEMAKAQDVCRSKCHRDKKCGWKCHPDKG
jgi:hypothetical protein